jgi:hypothetical protein
MAGHGGGAPRAGGACLSGRAEAVRGPGSRRPSASAGFVWLPCRRVRLDAAAPTFAWRRWAPARAAGSFERRVRLCRAVDIAPSGSFGSAGGRVGMRRPPDDAVFPGFVRPRGCPPHAAARRCVRAAGPFERRVRLCRAVDIAPSGSFGFHVYGFVCLPLQADRAAAVLPRQCCSGFSGPVEVRGRSRLPARLASRRPFRTRCATPRRTPGHVRSSLPLFPLWPAEGRPTQLLALVESSITDPRKKCHSQETPEQTLTVR